MVFVEFFKRNKNYSFTLILISLLFVPNFVLVAVGSDTITASWLKSIVFLSSGFLWMLLFPVFIKPKLFFILFSPVVVFQFFEVIHILLFKTPTSISVFMASMDTNFLEVKELLTSHRIVIYFCLITIIAYIYFLVKLESGFRFVSSFKWKVISLVIILHFAIAMRDYYISSILSVDLSFKDRVEVIGGSFNFRTTKTFPLNTYSRVQAYLSAKKNISRYHKNTSGFTFDSIDMDSVPISKTLVMVMGETARYDRFDSPNYIRKVTPNLDTTKNVTSFSKVYSGANLTRTSLPFIFSRSTPTNPNIRYTEKSFLQGFKEQGYKIYWISNQRYGPNSMISFYSKEADSLIMNEFSFESEEANDFGVIDQFDTLLNATTGQEKRLFILHTLGSHFRYNFRYPMSFEKFKPTIDSEFDLTNLTSKNKKELINSYDNSILFTDYILSELIDSLDKMDGVSALTYVSDHGENLFDDKRELVLHGKKVPTKYELHVPLLVWLSEDYVKYYPKKKEELLVNKTKFFSTSNFPYLMWGLSNIYVEDSVTKDLTSAHYNAPDTLYSLSNDVVYINTVANLIEAERLNNSLLK